MALTTIQTNNKKILFTKEINREFVRENMFSPYTSEGLDAVIRRRYEPKKGGEQMNIPLVTKLNNSAVGVGTLVGNEEEIENYGMRVWVDWARHAVVTNDAEKQKDSADIFGIAKPLLSDYMKELMRDEHIEAFMALPSESAPVGLGSGAGQRVNGILYEDASAAEKNTWNAANSDRVLYGAAVSNYNATHATALGVVDTTADTMSASLLSTAKRAALLSNPAIRPKKTKDGYEHYVVFCGAYAFRDLKNDLKDENMDGRPRSNNNVVWKDGDLEWDGMIIRQVPEISSMVEDKFTSLVTAGDSSSRVEPYFLCGKQSLVCAYGSMLKPTKRAEDDYEFITGVGVQTCYGVGKMFKKHPASGSNLKQWGMLTGFVNAAAN